MHQAAKRCGVAGLLALALGLGLARAVETPAPQPGVLTTSWHTEHGLPDANITAIAQTPDGYLWLGTFSGLVRFDGVRFTLLDASRAPALAGQRIAGLLVDSAGRLWVAGEFGAVFRGEQGEFKRVPIRGETVGPPLSAPTRSTHSRWLRPAHLAEDAEGTVWAHTAGTSLLSMRGDQATVPEPRSAAFVHDAVGMVSDVNRCLWVLAGNQLLQWTDGRWLSRLEEPGLTRGEPVLAAGRHGGVWLALPRGRWATGGGRVIAFRDGQLRADLPPTPRATNSPRSQVTALLETRDGGLWLGFHWGGVARLEGDAWRPPASGGVLAQSRVNCLFEDRLGAVWVGTLGDGLHRLTRGAVAALRLPAPARDHLVNTVCFTRDGSVWVGTDGAGAFRYAAGQFTHFGAREGLPTALAFSFCEDGAGQLWCGTDVGVLRWREGRFEPVPELGGLLVYVVAMLADRRGQLCFGTAQGVVRHEPGGFKLYRLGVTGPVEIRAIAEDTSGALWVGTIAHGLFRLRGDQVERIGAAQGLTHPDARSVWCDDDGGVWVGTLGGGLFRRRGERFEALTPPATGLPDATINGLVGDESGNLWCTSYNGVFALPWRKLGAWTPAQGPLPVSRWLLMSDGLDYRTCSGAGQPVISRAPDGRLWLVNQRGVAVVDPSQALTEEPPANVVIESVTVDGVEHPVRAGGQTIKAPSSARRFEFRYTVLNRARPTEARFRHRLAGVDADWVAAGEQRVAGYSQLPPGRYALLVAATGADGRWHQAGQELRLEVTPRLHERPLARFGAGALLLGGVAAGVWGVARARLRRRLAALERQRALEQERNRIARDMHDEVGARLTQMSLLSALTAGSAEDAAEVRGFTARIASLSREVVRLLDGIVWAVRPQNDTLESLVEYLGNATRELCEGSPVRCWFSLPAELPPIEVAANARHNLLLACREAVNNVLKHSGATELRMTVRLNNGGLEVSLEDNGRGFDVAVGESKRSGLLNMRTRLAELGGHCVFQSHTPGGTRVLFKLPLDRPGTATTGTPA